jgi:hypothetical protein
MFGIFGTIWKLGFMKVDHAIDDWGVSIKAGAYIVVPEGSQITDITMSSGSVIIYNL